jgi:hypothetical protein
MEIERLEKIGLTTASNRIKELKELKRKMTIAYEHFRYVKQEKIDAFNEKLKKETMKEDSRSYNFKCLNFIPLESYEEVPPLDVLDKIEEAQKLGCFDTFEIAKIQDIVQTKDPIVFGRINKCADRFFIAQWDDDVKIEQILNENEG